MQHIDLHEALQFTEWVLQALAQSLHSTVTNCVLCQVHFSQL